MYVWLGSPCGVNKNKRGTFENEHSWVPYCQGLLLKSNLRDVPRGPKNGQILLTPHLVGPPCLAIAPEMKIKYMEWKIELVKTILAVSYSHLFLTMLLMNFQP